MAQLTPAQFSAQLRKQADQLADGKALQIAAQTVHAMRVERIFDKGIDGAKYSDRSPIYISAKNSRSSKGGKFENYGAFKSAIGFDGSKVNLRVTNDLQSDFANSDTNSGTGKPDSGKVIQVNNSLCVEELRSEKNVDKWNGNIERFGDFGEFTTEEKETFDRVLLLELTAVLRGERK